MNYDNNHGNNHDDSRSHNNHHNIRGLNGRRSGFSYEAYVLFGKRCCRGFCAAVACYNKSG